VLGIECSCDDSCASIVGSDKRILSNVRLSQNDVHKAFNGIHPYHAIHAHQINVVSLSSLVSHPSPKSYRPIRVRKPSALQ
jgi:N6-L-threonylcarbamoyladenine synthase